MTKKQFLRTAKAKLRAILAEYGVKRWRRGVVGELVDPKLSEFYDKVAQLKRRRDAAG